MQVARSNGLATFVSSASMLYQAAKAVRATVGGQTLQGFSRGIGRMRAGMALIAMGFAAASCGAAPPTAKPTEWKVLATLHGKTKGGEVKPATDVSGMACAPEEGGKRLCLLVDDETQGVQVVVVDPAARSISPGDYIPLV